MLGFGSCGYSGAAKHHDGCFGWLWLHQRRFHSVLAVASADVACFCWPGTLPLCNHCCIGNIDEIDVLIFSWLVRLGKKKCSTAPPWSGQDDCRKKNELFVSRKQERSVME